MKTIGILTYHRSVNYGAIMQAYSLSKRLAKDFIDCKVEIIDYESKETYLLYHKSIKNYLSMIFSASGIKKKLIYSKNLIQYIFGNSNLREHAKLEKIFEKQLKDLPLSPKMIITDDINEFWNKVGNNYDVIIVGSDAVWNWQIKKFPNPYFLGEISKIKKISYAASSYGQDYLQLNDTQCAYLKNAWNTFSYIGVRDEPTEKFVKKIDAALTVHHNCDPTVFLDLEDLPIDDKDIYVLLKAKGVDFGKPVIGLMGKPWLSTIIRSLLGFDCQLVTIFFSNQVSDVYIDNLAPFQWAKVFQYFDVVFTHFFHGNLLSLKNGTPTIPIEQRSSYNQIHESKIRDFMRRIGLLKYCFFSDEIIEKTEEIRQFVDDMIQRKEVYSKIIIESLEKEKISFGNFESELRRIIDNDE